MQEVFRERERGKERGEMSPVASKDTLLPTLDRLLCVVRELTDGSRRGVGRTTHMMKEA
jgi:hypothetical protein